MAINFEQFFRSIVAQESGGDYSAVGPVTSYGRAYGRYQVLESNIWSWTKKFYGKNLTPTQFLANHEAQDAVARGQLKSYWDKYGARGAAAAWYGGEGSVKLHNSTNSQQGGPSIKDYVDSVINRAEGYASTEANVSVFDAGEEVAAVPSSSGGGGNKSSGGGGSSQSAPPIKPPSAAELAEQYGFVESLLNSNKELKSLFQKAVKGGWLPDKFQAELRDTKWWKTLNKSQREFLITQYGDPATGRQKLDQNQIKIKQLGSQMGIRLDDKGWKDLAYQYTYNGWTDQQLRYQLGRRLNMPGTQRLGEAGEIQDKLSEYAYNMGISVSDSWMDKAARDIVSGMATQQDFESKLREQAKATYSFWAKQIDGGQSVSDLASPYMQTMAQILELPPGSVNLFDPKIKASLQFRDKSGKSAVKPLWQFENEMRDDPRWKKTNNAQDSIMQVAHQVLSDFGVKY